MPQAAKQASSTKANGKQDAPARTVIVPADHIHAAKELEYQRGQLVKEIQNNRVFLRMLDTAGALDENEGAWLDVFYAQKKKGVPRTDEQTAATKALRKVAREEIAAERGEEVAEDEDEDEDEDES